MVNGNTYAIAKAMLDAVPAGTTNKDIITACYALMGAVLEESDTSAEYASVMLHDIANNVVMQIRQDKLKKGN